MMQLELTKEGCRACDDFSSYVFMVISFLSSPLMDVDQVWSNNVHCCVLSSFPRLYSFVLLYVQ